MTPIYSPNLQTLQMRISVKQKCIWFVFERV